MNDIIEQVAHMQTVANRWLNFASACGWIAFGLSVTALIWLLVSNYVITHKPKHERKR